MADYQNLKITLSRLRKISKQNLDVIFFCIFVFFVVFKTGFVSDDFYVLVSKPKKWFDLGGLEASPLLHFTHWIAFSSIPWHGQLLAEFLKASYAVFCFLSFFLFFNQFRDKEIAIWAGLSLLFFPNRDGSTFFFIGQHTMISLAFYLLAFVQANQDNKIISIILSFCGSFISYGSTPIATGLAVLFFLQKKYKKACWLALPNLIYVIYYFCITKLFDQGISRIKYDSGLSQIAKNFLIQFGSAFDATFGPSFWFKAFFTCKEAGLFGAILSLILYQTYLLLKTKENSTLKNSSQTKTNKNFLDATLAISIMTFFTLGIFALTGLYPQIAFNLGNRVTLIPTFLLIWIISARIFSSSFIFRILFLFTMLCGVGESTHWRRFTESQNELISKLKNENRILKLKESNLFLCKGFRFSKLGPFDHIEAASESWVCKAYLLAATGKEFNTLPLSWYLDIQTNFVYDKKYSKKYLFDKDVILIDLDNCLITPAKPKDLRNKISEMPRDFRHWVQIVPKKFQNKILKIMPRLGYLFSYE